MHSSVRAAIRASKYAKVSEKENKFHGMINILIKAKIIIIHIIGGDGKHKDITVWFLSSFYHVYCTNQFLGEIFAQR